MFKPLALYIGMRYTRAKRRNHFISFISLISMLSIAVGVTAMITILSVMNGFEKELRVRMLGMSPHVFIMPYFDNHLNDWPALMTHLKDYPNITGVAPFIQGQAMITRNQAVYGTLIQGIDPELEKSISVVQDKMLLGSVEALLPDSFHILIGEELQRSLGVRIGEQVTVVVPQATVTPVGLVPRMKRMTVQGVFRIGMHEFDSSLILMHMSDAAKLLRLPEGSAQGLNIKITDMFAAPQFADQLRQELPAGYQVADWTYRHANFFRAIQMEKRVMFIILTLIIAVAAFNIISTLVMLVTDKQADIAILRTLGATPLTIMAIFVVQGVIIGLFGTLLGVIGGVSLALNVETLVPAIENFFNMKFLSADVYYISDIPSDLRMADVYWITINAFLISLLATLYPAYRASRTQPAEALRYE
ncbi:lipoprotein-releasing ABC transporter permease subunit [Thioflexithrix psekupsensis]|uniref:ABC transporter permease n=1 Tax=Thioflexithrix psekupsensis TaxID=1570016 RepID=A0A251X3R0_9GAMM|nr:lipoprotein-releasing ABC transporter permease subunit [Thioflexithrix psekupsensis]OUD12091.1 ABC transporter permease [Thioflexithrix psekupsensis]